MICSATMAVCAGIHVLISGLVHVPVSPLALGNAGSGHQHTHDVQAYALSEELNKWLLFDDTNIKYIGSWREVAASMREGRHQPSLLFYERI
jgi:hypothetical protein